MHRQYRVVHALRRIRAVADMAALRGGFDNAITDRIEDEAEELAELFPESARAERRIRRAMHRRASWLMS